MFSYHPAIVERYPTIRAALVVADGLAVGAGPTGWRERYAAEQRAVAARLAGVSLAELPSIAAWRRVFSDFGAKPTRHRNAAEALLRRLTKHGDIPSINPLVDIGNLVSIRHAVPVAVFDRAGVHGAITVRFAEGDEPFTDLGSDGIDHPAPGEVVFADEDGVVCARRWCWRQSAQSATGPHTDHVLFAIEAHHDDGDTDVRAAQTDLLALLEELHMGARAQPWLLSASEPRAHHDDGLDPG